MKKCIIALALAAVTMCLCIYGCPEVQVKGSPGRDYDLEPVGFCYDAPLAGHSGKLLVYPYIHNHGSKDVCYRYVTAEDPYDMMITSGLRLVGFGRTNHDYARYKELDPYTECSAATDFIIGAGKTQRVKRGLVLETDFKYFEIPYKLTHIGIVYHPDYKKDTNMRNDGYVINWDGNGKQLTETFEDCGN
jgi:hypothetical protein